MVPRSIRSIAALVPLAALLLGCGKREQTPADAGAILTARTLGLAYLDENRLEEAEAEFEKLIRLSPDEPSGHANLGVVYMRLGRYQDALRSIDRAVARATDDPDIRLLQATAQRLSGRTDEARRTLEASLKTSPRHLKTLFALQAWDRLVEAAPANVAARFAFAEALLDSGRTAEARDQLELLRQRLPQLPSQAQRFFAAALRDLQANRPGGGGPRLAPSWHAPRDFSKRRPFIKRAWRSCAAPPAHRPGTRSSRSARGSPSRSRIRERS